MKIFCSYAFTGEDETAVRELMKMVVETLHSSGHEVYCDLYDEHACELMERNEVKEILLDAFYHLSECDLVVAIVTSPRRSIGQIMELGVALNSGKLIYLFEHVSSRSTTYLGRVSDAQYEWNATGELSSQLRKI
jgi:nucleoside 2-deoxyribosyltransferase